MSTASTGIQLQYANADQVAPRLWIGGDLESTRPALARAQLDELDRAGVTDIVDLRLEWNDEDWVAQAKPHLGYRWLGVDDAGQRMPDEWFEAGTAYVLARLAQGAGVLVHCHMGINRGPSMGFAVLLALGWDAIQALDRIRQWRPIGYVGYAEDALDWWLRRAGAGPTDRATGQHWLASWRSVNHLDVVEVIRSTRVATRLDVDVDGSKR
jgi:hypothetical protein